LITSEITFSRYLPPWPYKTNPVRNVCTGSIQPGSQLAVIWRSSNVAENSQPFRSPPNFLYYTEPRLCWRQVILPVAFWVQWQITVSTVCTYNIVAANNMLD